MAGSAVFSALMYLSPPTREHRKTLTQFAAPSHAATPTVCVRAPGRTATFSFAANSMIFVLNDGAVRNPAPEPTHIRAVSVVRTVPAPTIIFGWERTNSA